MSRYANSLAYSNQVFLGDQISTVLGPSSYLVVGELKTAWSFVIVTGLQTRHAIRGPLTPTLYSYAACATPYSNGSRTRRCQGDHQPPSPLTLSQTRETSVRRTISLIEQDRHKVQRRQNVHHRQLPCRICNSYWIHRRKLYRDEAYRCFIASKKCYFYRIRTYLVVQEWAPPPSSSCRPGYAWIHLCSSSLTSTFHLTPGSSTTKPMTSTASKMSWLTAITCSCRFARQTQNCLGSRG